jgi:hypothetical protein
MLDGIAHGEGSTLRRHWWSLCASTQTFPASTRDFAMWLRVSTRRARTAQQRPRQRQHRVSQAEVVELIAAYHQRKSIKGLAQRHEVHRTTVAALLGRHSAGTERPVIRLLLAREPTHPGRTVRWPPPWRRLSQLWRRIGRLKVGRFRSTRLAEQSLLNTAHPRPDRHRDTLLIRPQRFPRSRPAVQRAGDSDAS